MNVSNHIVAEKIAAYVENILVIENNNVSAPFSLPLFANGMPTLLFQTVKGKIKSDSNHLTLFGQTILPDKITLNENFILIAYFFKPAALTALFGFSAKDLTDNPISLSLINQHDARQLQDKLLHSTTVDEMIDLLDGFIFALTTKIKTDTKIIAFATRLIAQNPAKEILKQTQDNLALTERTFQRMFEQHVGISPNEYRRIAQFNAAFQQLNRRQFKNLTDIAFNNNYADQSHFIRAFKEFTSLTPSEYLEFSSRR